MSWQPIRKDAALRGMLEVTVSKLSARPFKSPETIATLGEAQFALGQDDQAKQNLKEAVAADPMLKPAQNLKAKVDLQPSYRRCPLRSAEARRSTGETGTAEHV
jgi:hypothetical protein